MKIIFSLILLFSLSIAFSVATQTYLDQDNPWEWNYEYERALEEQWGPLFDEAREKVQDIKNTPKETKTTELIHKIGDDFCQWFFGSCDENSLSSRFAAWCGKARDVAIEKMQENDVWFVKNNTELLLASYTTCLTRGDDAIEWFKEAGGIEAAWYNADKLKKSHTTWLEKMNNTFQEKVSTVWDVFTKKVTNFVRSVEGLTETVNTRWW